MREQVTAIVNSVLANGGREPVEAVTDSTDLRKDLGFDSLDLAELTVKIESEFQVDVFRDGVVHTIGEVLRKIR